MSSTHSWKIGKSIWNALLGDYFMRDDVSDAQTTITYPHHEIHEGDHYRIFDFMTLGSAGTLDFCVTTYGTGKDPHILWNALSTQPAELHIYKNGSWGADGTAVVPVNSNFDVGMSDSVQTIVYNPTVADLGTRLGGFAWGKTDVPSRALGGDNRSDDEFKLGTAQNVIWRFVSLAAANKLSYDAGYYEHTPSNT